MKKHALGKDQWTAMAGFLSMSQKLQRQAEAIMPLSMARKYERVSRRLSRLRNELDSEYAKQHPDGVDVFYGPLWND